MRIRAHVHAAIALVASFPSLAAAGELVLATTNASGGSVVAGATVQVTCFAEGSPSMGTPTAAVSVDISVTGGTVTPSQLTGAVNQQCSSDPTRTCSVIQGAASWATTATPGDYTATCTATFQPFYGPPVIQSANAMITTVTGSLLPPVVGPIEGPTQVAASGTAQFSVTATDPNNPPLALTYAWGTTGGTLVPDPVNPAAVTWQAPATPGSYTLTAMVSNGSGVQIATKTVNVIFATYQAQLTATFVSPRRLSVSDSGSMAVVDRQTLESGAVALVTARGELLGSAALPKPAQAVTHGAGMVWATTSDGKLYKIDPRTGRTLGEVPLDGGPLGNAVELAYDASGMRLWIVETDLGRVRVVDLDGHTVFKISTAAGAPLLGPIDVAVDAARGRAWVLVGNSSTKFLHGYDLSGAYAGSYADRGSGLGKLTRGGGMTIDPQGRVYASDSFQGVIQVFASTGAPLATVGSWGTTEGTLNGPGDLAILGNGDVAVANTGFGRIDRFGTGAALPVCAGDQDCDGLADAWETANGLNPLWAGDALLDLDGDGLVNAEELALGTNPNNADTDGDGYSDGDEVLAGFDPTDPNDHSAVVAVSGPAQSPPGLVRLSAVAAGPGTCTVAWAQADGPEVTLQGGDTSTPSFVARAAGTYSFDATASCGGNSSAPARVAVDVVNVPPRADAGRVVVASPGSVLRLDALASSDANGDPLTFWWDQTLGPPAAGSEAGESLVTRLRSPGLYAFQVTASDGAGGETSAEVPVLVAATKVPTALARALPGDAEVGGTVVLDASASVADESSSWSWTQVAGPAVGISGADQPVASFTPVAPGRYDFEVTVASGLLRSPPARVQAYVAPAGGALPVVTASGPTPPVVPANAATELTASTGGSATFAWRQVSGPAAGLTGADGATATVVPFAPGFFVFEVTARDGEVEGRPARVAFEARAGGSAIPVARVVAPQVDPVVGQLVFLDGRSSTGAVRYRWTQVDGPWVVLGAQAGVTSFRPLVPGTYAFELEVEDGTARSAPVRVEVTVGTAGGVQ